MAILNRTPPPLDENKVQALQAEINAFIDARAAEMKKTCEGVPVQVLRNILTNRSGGCECRAYQQIKQQDAERLERSKQ